MTDMSKYKNVSLTKETYKVLEALSKVLLPDAKLSISKTIEVLSNEKARKLNGKIKKAEVKKIICPTCSGNGFVTNTDIEDGEKYIHQCWDCDSEGEYYVTTNNNLIGNPDYDDDNDLLEWLREIPVRRV